MQLVSDAGAGTYVGIGNNKMNDGTGAALVGMDVAIYEDDGTGHAQGSPLFGSGAGLWMGVTVPASGEWGSPTFDPTGHLGADNTLIVAFATPTGTVYTTTAVATGYYVFGTKSVDPLPGGFALSPNAVMTVRAYFSTRRPRVVCEGDSLVVGYSVAGGITREQSAFSLVAGANDWAVDVNGYPGSTLAQWTGGATPSFNAGQIPTGALKLCDLTINSLSLWANLAAAQAEYAAYISYVQGLGYAAVVACTLPPSLAYVANDALRVTVNAWLMGGTSGFNAVADVSTAVADPGTPSQLLPAYDAGDGTHWNIAGHAAVSTVLGTAISSVL